MAENTKDKSTTGGSGAWEAISAFEQILEVIPNDVVALDALANAYEIIGDLTRSGDYYIRLATAYLEQGDVVSALGFKEKIESIAGTQEAAREVLARIEAMQQVSNSGPAAIKRPVNEQPSQKRANTVADELSYAWHLFQSGLLTQEEYAAIAQDLTEVSSNESTVTVSVLHVLHDRGFRTIDQVIAYSSKDTATPIISLNGFEIQREVAALLPVSFVVQQGALAFETLGADVLVVVLNPYNSSLRSDIQSLIGRRCHFFVTTPSEFDAACNRVKSLLEGAS